MICIIIFISFKNIQLIKRYKQNKEYIECYQDALSGKEDAYDRVIKYIEKEKDIEFKNKASIIKLYLEIHNDKEYNETLKGIDFKTIFVKKDKLSDQLVKLNSDTFIFVVLIAAQANVKNKKDVLDSLVNKLNDVIDLNKYLEYHLCISFINAMNNIDDKGIKFMTNLLEGNYTEYVYEKNMIHLYKRIAATTLAYNNELNDEYFKEDLHKFAESKIGELLLKDLTLYELYKPIVEEENTNEEIAEINEDNSNIEEDKKEE